MKIKWNGHASFSITAKDGTVIITDPYEPGGFGGALAYGPIRDKADIVTVSHEHADHNYVDGLEGKPQVVKESKTVKGISFKAIHVYHDDSRGSKRGENNIFVFTVDGVKLCHLGDLGHTLPKEVKKEIGQVDALFLPIGGFFTIDPNEATRVMQDLNPRVVIPMHYKTEKCGFPIAKLDDFLHGKEKSVVNVKASETNIAADSLPAQQQIWVLSHAC